MAFLRIPNEVLQEIVGLVIQTVGLGRSLKLRAINRKAAIAISPRDIPHASL